jgi:hypothetical protein
LPSIDPVAPGTGWLDAGAAAVSGAAAGGAAEVGVVAAGVASLVVAAGAAADAVAAPEPVSSEEVSADSAGFWAPPQATTTKSEQTSVMRMGLSLLNGARAYAPLVLYVYVAAAVVGLVLLVASLFGAGHDHAAGHDGTTDGDASPAFALLSVRVWTYVLAFGGATGVLLRLVGHEGEPVSGIGGLAVGIAAAAMARFVIGRAARAGAAGMVQARDLVGRSAAVVVPFAGATTGKVRVRVGGADVDLLATTEDGEALGRNDEVLIVEVKEGGSALVTRNPASK